MDKKMYARGMMGQAWYNFTEYIALALQYRPMPNDITYTKKLKYADKKNNYINIYSRNDLKDKKQPLLLYIHGGGWVSGVAEMRNSYILNWAELGFYACSINYSYAPQEVFPTQLQEIFTAIDLIFDHAEQWNIDTDNIVIAGESAGGYFISYVAACVSDWERLEKIGITFKHKDSFKIKAVVSHSGCFDVERLVDIQKEQSKFPDIKMMLSTFFGKPYNELKEYVKTSEGKLLSPNITAEFPPTYMVWCTRDKLRYETFDMSKQLEELSVPFKLFKADGAIGNHAWSIVTLFSKAKACLKDTWDFTLPHLCDYFEKTNGEWKFKI